MGEWTFSQWTNNPTQRPEVSYPDICNYLTESPGNELLTCFLTLRHFIWLFSRLYNVVLLFTKCLAGFSSSYLQLWQAVHSFLMRFFNIRQHDTESQLMAITVINDHLLFDLIHLLFMTKMKLSGISMGASHNPLYLPPVSLWAEWHIWMGEGPPRPPQVFRDWRRPSQCQAGVFLRTHWLAAGAQTSRRHWKGQKTGTVRPEGRWSGHVSETVSKH